MSKKGHHGGAWKVAYADFVTAMMALFLVLWLTAQDEKIKEAIERAFKNPFSSVTKESVGIISAKDKTQAVSTEKGNFDSASAIELTMLRRLNQDLMKIIETEENQLNNSVKMELTPEGLRVSIFDRTQKPIFEGDTTTLTPHGKFVLQTLSWVIARYDTFLTEVEGHTEHGMKPRSDEYTAWELSADRANVARRALIDYGVKDYQIRKVAGFADTMPLPNFEPSDEINRRVTILLRVNSSNR